MIVVVLSHQFWGETCCTAINNQNRYLPIHQTLHTRKKEESPKGPICPPCGATFPLAQRPPSHTYRVQVITAPLHGQLVLHDHLQGLHPALRNLKESSTWASWPWERLRVDAFPKQWPTVTPASLLSPAQPVRHSSLSQLAGHSLILGRGSLCSVSVASNT